MNPEVSIIIISYNIYPQIKFTLYSLEKQTYPLTKMEVVLVDDCSTDRTFTLRNYTGPFRFKYLRSDTNLGRSGAKNLGLREAKGEIIIFLDGDVMVDPNFVANHLRHYQTNDKISVSGNASHYSTFSVLCPGFSTEQIKRLHSIIRSKPFLMKHLSNRLYLPYEYIQSLNAFWEYANKNQRTITLFTKEHIYAQLFKLLSYPTPYFPPKLLEKYGAHLTGFHLAWAFFITRNVSVRKSLLEEVGPFNEVFKGWGSEDWELGYRLYNKGVKFLDDRHIISYHQEHPFSSENRRADQMLNYAKFTILHPKVEVCAITLGILGKKNFFENNDIIEDYYQIQKEFPEYVHSQNVFIKLTQQIPILMAEEKPVTGLWRQAGLEKETKTKKKLLDELESLRRTGKYRHFLSAIELLLTL
ncbi:MAG: glycosyltransferase family 2 protein [Dethiobacteria bacterium]|jgi:glycosyltransferase involved in cell wall biosynthesis